MILENFMGLTERPFHPYRKKNAYEPKFAIHANPAKLIESQEIPSQENWQSAYSQETPGLKNSENLNTETPEYENEDWEEDAYEEGISRRR